MNKTQTAIVGLAVVELLLVCFFIPQLFFRVQDSELAKEVEKVSVEPANLASFNSTIYTNSSPLTLDEKIDFANSYDGTITSIFLEKGEKYSANQICSARSGIHHGSVQTEGFRSRVRWNPYSHYRLHPSFHNCIYLNTGHRLPDRGG